jgi:hypothetical protein
MKPCGWLLCALLLVRPAVAAESEGLVRLHGWKLAAIAALSARGDANSLATAAMLSTAGGAELAARASELAPDSAPLAWINLRLCALTMGCDFRAAATAMRWVDADNPVAWLPTLDVAQRDLDSVEVERLLFDMAQGKRIMAYTVPVSVLMFDALDAVVPALPHDAVAGEASRLALVLEIAQARLVPAFTALEDACREAAPGTERHEACLKVARKLQRSDTVAGELAGIAIERRTWPPESREARALAERRRTLEWQRHAAARFDAPLLPWVKPRHTRWHLEQMRSLHREQDVLVAVLQAQGMPTSPPAMR